MTLSVSGLRGSVDSSCHSAGVRPVANCVGSKLGLDTIASTSPVGLAGLDAYADRVSVLGVVPQHEGFWADIGYGVRATMDFAGHSKMETTLIYTRTKAQAMRQNMLSVDYLGDQWTFLDVPGSIEFQHDAFAALAVCDTAVLVCEPSPERVVSLTPLLKFIEDNHIPHINFVIDRKKR